MRKPMRLVWRTSPSPFGHVISASPVSRQEFAAMVSNIPRDTRDLTARIMGDPVPGRSALDRKSNRQVSPLSTVFTAGSKESLTQQRLGQDGSC